MICSLLSYSFLLKLTLYLKLQGHRINIFAVKIKKKRKKEGKYAFPNGRNFFGTNKTLCSQPQERGESHHSMAGPGSYEDTPTLLLAFPL